MTYERKTYIILLATLALGVASGCTQKASSIGQSSAESLPDRKFYLPLVEHPIRVDITEGWVLHFLFFLEGKEEDLRGLSEDELAAILQFVRELARENDLALYSKWDDELFLVETASSINELLGKNAVRSIRFTRMTFEEQLFY